MSERDADGGALRILVVSPIRLYRDGLVSVLAALDDVGAVYACELVLDGIDMARRTDAHVVLLDMSAVSNTAAARTISRELPFAKIVALALSETEQSVLACAEAGIVGYVSREGTLDDLIAAVRHAVKGEALCSPMIAGGLMRRVAALAEGNRTTTGLTAREREVADQVVLGLSNRAIAERLGIELCTVKNHVHNILDKLGAAQRADVARHLLDCLVDPFPAARRSNSHACATNPGYRMFAARVGSWGIRTGFRRRQTRGIHCPTGGLGALLECDDVSGRRRLRGPI